MKWTFEKPKPLGTGYYWFRTIEPHHWGKPYVIHVTFDGIIENAYVQKHGMVERWPLLEFANPDPRDPEVEYLWYGPISPPVEEGIERK